jgi:crotonobetainyl-CoA:carnitine CoA-transferase CaiB-like acyl-CoA transferase
LHSETNRHGWHCYKDRDGKWFWLRCPQGVGFWPGVTRAIGRPDLVNDQRFDSFLFKMM